MRLSANTTGKAHNEHEESHRCEGKGQFQHNGITYDNHHDAARAVGGRR